MQTIAIGKETEINTQTLTNNYQKYFEIAITAEITTFDKMLPWSAQFAFISFHFVSLNMTMMSVTWTITTRANATNWMCVRKWFKWRMCSACLISSSLLLGTWQKLFSVTYQIEIESCDIVWPLHQFFHINHRSIIVYRSFRFVKAKTNSLEFKDYIPQR